MVNANNIEGIYRLKALEKLDLYSDLDINAILFHFKEMPNLVELHLADSISKQLSSNIYELKNLQCLDLENSTIEKIEPDIGKLKELRYLYLKGTRISTLPEEVINCKKLKEISFPDSMESLPVGIGQLKELSELNLENTKIEFLPISIGCLQDIIRLKVPPTLNSLPDSIGYLQKIKKLDLKNTKIDEVPETIGDLYQLEKIQFPFGLKFLPKSIKNLKKIKSLDLSYINLDFIPFAIGDMTGLQHLKLPIGLLTLPNNIGELRQLKYLDASLTNLEKLPDSIGNLIRLHQLTLPSSIQCLPDSFGNLCNITKLELEKTKLTVLPEGICNLKNVVEITFPPQLKVLPQFIGNLCMVKHLNLKNTLVEFLPESIGKMESLEKLEVPKTLKSLPGNIGNLKRIRYLNLKNTKITYLPNEIGMMLGLEYLNIEGTEVKELPTSIGNLKNLKRLILNRTDIQYLPNEICDLENLELLLASDSQLKEIPSDIGKMSKLRIIDFSNTKIERIPDSVEEFIFTDLESFQLNGLKLDYISKGLANLILHTCTYDFFHSSIVSINKLQLVNQDTTLFNCSLETIKSFYSDELVRLNECKVIFLGDGAVGKSSIIDRLMGNDFQLNRTITDGISIKRWEMNINNQLVKIRFWDFGGQEIMQTMHLCFLTERTIYVIVLDSRQDQFIERDAINWLQTVKTFAPNSPVILVLNKCDTNPMAMLNLASLKHDFPQLVDCIRTSALNNTNVDKLEELISYTIQNYSSYSVVFNKKWLALKEQLEDMEVPYISNREYVEICQKHKINDMELQISLLKWFCDLGVSYHYTGFHIDYDPDAINVLNPEWVTVGMYRLLLHTEAKKGIVSLEEIYKVMISFYKNDVNSALKYTKREVDFILDVMRQKGLSHQIGCQEELIPLKLEEGLPDKKSFIDKESDNVLHFAIKGNYLPNGIIHKLIIERIDEVDLDNIWRKGVYLYNKDKRVNALVELRYEYGYRLDIYILANNQTDEKEYLSIIRDNILKIIHQYGLKKFEEVICYQFNGLRGEELYLRVWEPYLRGSSEIYLLDINEFESPASLLKVIYTEKQIIEREKGVTVNKFINNGNITDANISFGEESRLYKNTRPSYKVVATKLSNIEDISDSDYRKLLKLLEEIKDNQQLPIIQRFELRDVLKNKDKKSGWKKVQDFLSNAANFTTILNTTPLILQSICTLLKI